MPETPETLDQKNPRKIPKIGDLIKEARLDRKISLEVVSQHTKIGTTMLEHLENNRFDKFPNKTYVAGHVKSCAKLLGLNVGECLTTLREDYENIYPPEKEKIETLPPNPEKDQKTGKSIPYRGIALALFFILPPIYFIISRDGGDRTEDVSPIEENFHESPIESQVLSSTTPLIEAQPLAEVEEPLPSPEEEKGGEEERVTLRPITSPLYSLGPPLSDEDINLIPEEIRASFVEGKQNLFVLAQGSEVWITYQRDHGPVHQFFLREGQHLFLQGDIILMFLGRLSATRVFLNARPLEMNSVSQVKTLIFPQEVRDQYYFPLFIYREDGTAINSKDYRASLPPSF